MRLPRALLLALSLTALFVAAAALSGCCNVPCDPCCTCIPDDGPCATTQAPPQGPAGAGAPVLQQPVPPEAPAPEGR